MRLSIFLSVTICDVREGFVYQLTVEINFCSFFHDPQKKFPRKKFPEKFSPQNTPLSKFSIQALPFTCNVNHVDGRLFLIETKRNLKKNSEIKKMKLQSVHHKYLAVKSFKEKDRLKALY